METYFADDVFALLFVLTLVFLFFLLGALVFFVWSMLNEQVRKFRDNSPKPRRGETMWDAYKRSQLDQHDKRWYH